jgi:hypothetical protein
LALLVNCGVVIIEGGVLVRAGPLALLEFVVALDSELSWGVVDFSTVLLAIDFLGVSFVAIGDLLG